MNSLWISVAIAAGGGTLLVGARFLSGKDRPPHISLVVRPLLAVAFLVVLAGIVLCWFGHAPFEIIASLTLVASGYAAAFVLPSPTRTHNWNGYSCAAHTATGAPFLAAGLLGGLAGVSSLHLGESNDDTLQIADAWSETLLQTQNQYSGTLPAMVSPLYTDLGNPIAVRTPLQHAPLSLNLIERQNEMLRRFRLGHGIIQVACGWEPCNCHGFTFAEGQCWIPSDQVPMILEENGYREVALPCVGDVAVYKTPQGEITHTGVVVAYQRGLILVESKWGRMGRFVHPHDRHCYIDSACSFHRSHRLGNTVYGVPPHEGSFFPAAEDDAVEHPRTAAPSGSN